MKSSFFCRLGVGLGLIVSSLAAIVSGQLERSKPAPSRPELSPGGLQEYSDFAGHTRGPADPCHAIHQFFSRCGMQLLSCGRSTGEGRQTEAEGTQDDADDDRHQPGKLCGQAKNHVLLVPPRVHSPVTTPLIVEAGNSANLESVPAEPSNVMPDPPQVDAIISRYVDAIGGPSAIARLSTRVGKGHIALAGRQFPIEIFSKIPGKRLSVVHLSSGDNVIAYDGASGWSSTPNRPAHDLPAAGVARPGWKQICNCPSTLGNYSARSRPAGQARSEVARCARFFSGLMPGELVPCACLSMSIRDCFACCRMMRLLDLMMDEYGCWGRILSRLPYV